MLAMVIAIAILSERNVRKQKYEKLEKYQDPKEELEMMWKIKAKLVPVIIGALGIVTQ